MGDSVAIIGAGSWGTTLARIAAGHGASVRLWTRRAELATAINEARENRRYLPGVRLPPSLTATADLQDACQAQLIIVAVPSHGLRRIAYRLGEHVSGEHVLIHTAKGIEIDSLKLMSQVLREETCVRKIGVLSGPNLAGELARERPAGTLIASRYAEVFERGRLALQTHYFRVYSGHDMLGAEIGGAFKNIVAIAAGIADGLGLGDNSKAMLLTRGVAEMARFGQALGAKVLTFAGMAGIGDLIATCASPLSRNHRVGQRLAGGETLDQIYATMYMVAEGVRTTQAVRRYAGREGVDLPIVSAVHRVLYEGVNAQAAIDELMTLPSGPEFAR